MRFPDAPSVNTCGGSIEEALEMAVDALSAIMVMGRKGREYHTSIIYNEIQAEAEAKELVFPIIPAEKTMEEYRPKNGLMLWFRWIC